MLFVSAGWPCYARPTNGYGPRRPAPSTIREPLVRETSSTRWADAAITRMGVLTFSRRRKRGPQDRDVSIRRWATRPPRVDYTDHHSHRSNGRRRSPLKKLVADSGELAKRGTAAKRMMKTKAPRCSKHFPMLSSLNIRVQRMVRSALQFFPNINPHSRPPTRELQVFRSKSGNMWKDRAERRPCPDGRFPI